MKTNTEIVRAAGIRDCTCDGTKGCLDRLIELARADERKALRPRFWTNEMDEAWHKAIPDVVLAFDELIRARGTMPATQGGNK